jgi:hypothetical protein
MKILSLSHHYRRCGVVGAVVCGLLALPVLTRADDEKKKDHEEHAAEKHVEHAEKKAEPHAERKADAHVAKEEVHHSDHIAKEEVHHADHADVHVRHEPSVALEKRGDPNVVVRHAGHVVHDPHVVIERHHHPNWVLREGNGWRGRGWYWGPPGVVFFAEAPGVTFYASRDDVPVEYDTETTTTTDTVNAPGDDVGAAVQKALADQGYYHGAVDGQIGPLSQRAIKRYQADHGLDPTGLINDPLLKSLGID